MRLSDSRGAPADGLNHRGTTPRAHLGGPSLLGICNRKPSPFRRSRVVLEIDGPGAAKDSHWPRWREEPQQRSRS